uniref:Corticotropin-releasing factor domain-containing protein n=1 Tax=Arion vulgaris TaxID=1028688 RepID=A0A0B6Z636_9EUPU
MAKSSVTTSTFIMSSSHVTRVLLLSLMFTLISCSGPDDSDVSEQERTQGEYPQGIARLLFKHMRFRDLPELSESKEDQFDVPNLESWPNRATDPDFNSAETTYFRNARNPPQRQYFKREQQELLVNNLAALLADSNRGKNSASTLRMPSLRFG